MASTTNPTITVQEDSYQDLGGNSRREAGRIWRDLAVSEARINLLKVLIKEGRGLKEIEDFNMGLASKFKSKKFQKLNNQPSITGKAIVPVMKLKLADEQSYHRELVNIRNRYRKELAKNLGNNSRKFKNMIADLRQEAKKTKKESTDKFKEKMSHIRKNYSPNNKEDEEIPEDLQEYSELKILNKIEYENLEPDSYEIKVIGDVELTNEEKSVLTLHPKFCILDKLTLSDFEHEQEAAFAKLRMEKTKDEEYSQMDEKEVEEAQEVDARSRQVFNPVEKVYDSRRRRVTDLKECSRITLPKPLHTDEEATMEVRRKSQQEVFKEYMKKYTKNGNQETNLSDQEQAGLKSLQKRILKRELIIMKTDKSSKFAVTTEEEYIKMGRVHTGGDSEVTRQELQDMEEYINGHTRAWAQIWQSGVDHNHQGRIIASKVQHSENIADLYLMFKDHKMGNKTRPTATGHTSNTLGMSNAVAEVMEAVSCSETRRYNTISSEDMLANMYRYNREVENNVKEWKRARISKLRCKKCNIMEYIDCPNTEEHPWESILSGTWPPRGSPSPGNPKEEEEINKIAQSLAENNCCGNMITEELRTTCKECGPGIKNEDIEYSVIGNDVKALYPSITSENTGRIIRKRIERTNLEFEGFDWKKGAAYIAMNTNLTSEIEEIEHLLPVRKHKTSKELKISAITNNWEPENKFEYKTENINKHQIKQIIARVVEVAVRMLFENHVYRFAGKMYKQNKGGSIGDRWTGAASEMVMQDWSEDYAEILHRSGLKTPLLAGYVDDGRQGTTVLPLGSRYSKEENKFIVNKEAELEDIKTKANGETKNQRMARVCLEAMNSINKDLEFTVECQEEFENERLPTLDFAIWQNKDGKIEHSYYQKEMKTPFVISARSAMASQQRIQIEANELTRRLFNIGENNEQREYNKVVEQFTQELRNSEYKYSTAKEIVVSGLRGLRTRLKNRKMKGQDKYRTAASTARTREKKKLLERENWYKNKENTEVENTEKIRVHRRSLRTKKPTKIQINKENLQVKAVMFVPFTPGSELARKLRENEEKMGKFTNNKLKIVERAGVKLQDILTKANPWKGQECQRTNCILCLTKQRTEKNQTQDCHKRNLVYETRCLTCENKEKERIENSGSTEEEKREQMNNIKLYKYIGETSRSTYERGWEHTNDLVGLKSTSHMLKHAVGVHPEQDPVEVQFGMKVIKYTQSSFERQIRESVTIQVERKHHHLLNSRSEYNRCSLPRLCAQIGEGEYKEYNKELELEKTEEEKIEKKIRELRKHRNKLRLHPTREQGPRTKRRKLNNTEYISIEETWGQPETSKPRKNKEIPTENTENENKKKREQSPRPPRGSPSPGTREQENRTSINMTEEVEEHLDIEWDEKFSEHRNEILREQDKRTEHTEPEKEKEQSWELYRLCKTFLEENSETWRTRKIQRENEKNRIKRLEQAGLLRKATQIRYIEKNIEKGIEKLTPADKEKLRIEEQRNEKIEIENARKDLWKFRGKEKKHKPENKVTYVQELGRKAEKIAQLLKQEREKKEQEKKRIEKQEAAKRTREQKRKEKLEQERKIEEHWAMYRWTTEYIEKNASYWEYKRKLREQERQRVLDNWDKQNRMEKIRTLKTKWLENNAEKERENPEPGIKIDYNSWREQQTEKENEIQEPEIKTAENKEIEQQKMFPIFKKLRDARKIKIPVLKTPEIGMVKGADMGVAQNIATLPPKPTSEEPASRKNKNQPAEKIRTSKITSYFNKDMDRQTEVPSENNNKTAKIKTTNNRKTTTTKTKNNNNSEENKKLRGYWVNLAKKSQKQNQTEKVMQSDASQYSNRISDPVQSHSTVQVDNTVQDHNRLHVASESSRNNYVAGLILESED